MSEDLTKNLPNDNTSLILARLDSIDGRLDSIEKRFDAVESRLDSIDVRLTTLEDKVERRLLETRPIWESVLEQLKEVNARLIRVENESKDFRQMFRGGYSDLARVQGDIEIRLEKLERRNQT